MKTLLLNRVASNTDVLALCEIAEKTFRQTFEAHHDLVNFEDYVQHAFSEETLSLAIRDLTFLAYPSEPEPEHPETEHPEANASDASVPIGYFRLRHRLPKNTNLLPETIPTKHCVELERFYLDAAWHSKGLGAAMMHGCESEAQKHGFKAIWLCVWEENTRAIAFYEREGFRNLGPTKWSGGACLGQDYLMLKSI